MEMVSCVWSSISEGGYYVEDLLDFYVYWKVELCRSGLMQFPDLATSKLDYHRLHT